MVFIVIRFSLLFFQLINISAAFVVLSSAAAEQLEDQRIWYISLFLIYLIIILHNGHYKIIYKKVFVIFNSSR